MRSLATVPLLIRGALVALLTFVTLGAVLSGPAGFAQTELTPGPVLLSEVKKLTASEADPGGQFGNSVPLSGDTAFRIDQGSASSWGELKKFTGRWDFGTGVAVSGDTAVVGSPLDSAGGRYAGAPSSSSATKVAWVTGAR